METVKLRKKVVKAKYITWSSASQEEVFGGDHFVALSDETFEQRPTQTWITTLSKNILRCEQKTLKSVKFARRFVYFLCAAKTWKYSTWNCDEDIQSDMDTLLEDMDDAELKAKLNSLNHFLVEFEIEKGRHSVLNFTMSSFNNSS